MKKARKSKLYDEELNGFQELFKLNHVYNKNYENHALNIEINKGLLYIC